MNTTEDTQGEVKDSQESAAAPKKTKKVFNPTSVQVHLVDGAGKAIKIPAKGYADVPEDLVIPRVSKLILVRTKMK